MLDDLLGIVETLIGKRPETARVPKATGGRPADRLSSLHDLLIHLDRELPQVIAESLFEAGAALSADVAMLVEVQNNALFIAYSSDPSLLEETVPWMRAVTPGAPHLTRRTIEALDFKDAVATRLTPANREWLLVFGSRNAPIDRRLFEEYEERLANLFSVLLRKRAGDAANQANVDHLTGLPDRWATMRRIAEAVIAAQRNNTRAAVLFIDVNGFKQVNDTLGHGEGDKVLRSIATQMRSSLRTNEFVGRIGGDEFAVVLSPVKSVEEAEHVAQRLYAGAQEFPKRPGMSVSLGIGIALYPDHASDQEEWLHHADLAMYRAKRTRKSYCVYDRSWSDEGDSVTPVVHCGRRYEEQFLLCFQPIFDVHTGRVAAAEALVRWLHPQDGLLSATSAINAAGHREKFEIDMWVARNALMYAEEWRAHGIERVHVNLGDYSDETYRGLMQVIAASEVDPQLLAVELNKNRDAEEDQKFARFVGMVGATGASVGIDDFAAGPLDLAMLEQLPIRFVKLSRLLLPSAGVSGKGIEAIVAFAKVLDWDVIATRVASSDDRRLIRNSGVKYMQGFAFAQPMTAIDFQSWVEGTPHTGLVG